MTPKERALRIELVRARAALERQTMARSTHELVGSLHPRALLRGMMPKGSGLSMTDWIFKVLTLARRYPLLTSSVSAVVTGAARRKNWWRIGIGLLLSWQLARHASRK
ncbi:hypothetical protein [Pollutimonas thiosulfatoxidans]|nr:hypothetical protein [Pollutimonas thiosulfatoxidans]